MAGETRIIAFGNGSSGAAGNQDFHSGEPVETLELDSSWETEEEQPPIYAPPRRWPVPVAGAALVLGWTAFFGWAMADRILSGPTPVQWIELVRDWAVPVLLLAVAALVLLRNSRREAMRFGQAANLLSRESAQLEHRLSTVNRELSLAREFIAAQSRDLETVGRLAADRLSTEADRMQGLIRDNHARVEAIGTVSAAALDNMEKLRGQLPVIASSAKDVTNNIGNAGRTAHAQLQEMINGFHKLNDFGQASERQIELLRGLVDETMSEYARQTEQFADIAATRFATLHEDGQAFRTQLESHEVEALASVRTRASAMAEELEQTRQLLDGHEAESLTSMRARLSALREEATAIARALRDGETRAVEGWQASVTRMKEDLQSALVALQEAETEAAEASRARIAAIGDDLARLEQQSLDQAGRFTADVQRRQAETMAAEEAATTQLRAHLAALDEAAAARRKRQAEIEAGDAEMLRQNLSAFDTELAERRARHEQLELETSERLRQRFDALDAEIAARRSEHEAQGGRIVAQTEAISAQLVEFERRVAEVAAHGGAAEQALGASLKMLTGRLAESRSTLAGTDREIAALTDSSVRLLELIQASVKHSAEELPQALRSGEAQLGQIEARMAALREAAHDTDARGATLAATVEAATAHLRQGYAELGTLQAEVERGGAAHGETLMRLRQELDVLAGNSARLAQDTREHLSEALEELSRATQATLAGFGESGAQAIAGLVQQLRSDTGAAIEQAMRTSAAETAGRLEQTVAQAASISRDAALQLREQLGKVNELAANLESRVAHARERAEEQVDNDFTRRVALITESLNSNAIDIAKALSTDVADTAWAAYLRGDRGIFTRRAVSLIDNGEARTIAQIYERDREFHEHVSRFIHDFEAMLRQVLSARDGQAMGVTLLSSDMGKLYVALAQAIQRLRN
jgi:hypothetical protein